MNSVTYIMLRFVIAAMFGLAVWFIYPGTVKVCRESVEILFYTGAIGSLILYLKNNGPVKKPE